MGSVVVSIVGSVAILLFFQLIYGGEHGHAFVNYDYTEVDRLPASENCL
jgi:hypothetical protein